MLVLVFKKVCININILVQYQPNIGNLIQISSSFGFTSADDVRMISCLSIGMSWTQCNDISHLTPLALVLDSAPIMIIFAMDYLICTRKVKGKSKIQILNIGCRYRGLYGQK